MAECKLRYSIVLRRLILLSIMCTADFISVRTQRVAECVAHSARAHCVYYNNRSQDLASSAIQSSSRLISDVFLDSSSLMYTSTGYNLTFGHKHWKVYTDSNNLTSKFLFDVKMNPSLNSSLLEDINFICTS